MAPGLRGTSALDQGLDPLGLAPGLAGVVPGLPSCSRAEQPGDVASSLSRYGRRWRVRIRTRHLSEARVSFSHPAYRPVAEYAGRSSSRSRQRANPGPSPTDP